MSGGKNDTTQKTLLELAMATRKIRETQERMERDVRDIRNRLFDPDEGLYARVCRNTAFRASAVKWLWILTTGVTLSILHVLFRYFTQ